MASTFEPEPDEDMADDSNNFPENEDDEGASLNAYNPYYCAFCGEENEVFVDASGAMRQRFTEDCAVCCRPNLITIQIERDGFVSVEAEREYDA